MFRHRWIRDEDHARLLEDIGFWRVAFDRERERADRLNDALLGSIGRAPVSQEGVAETRVLHERVKEARDQMMELLSDDDDAYSGILDELEAEAK